MIIFRKTWKLKVKRYYDKVTFTLWAGREYTSSYWINLQYYEATLHI